MMNKEKKTLPEQVLDALRFYASGAHYFMDKDSQEFDTVSGEPSNWLYSQRDFDDSFIEDGGIARAALKNRPYVMGVDIEPIQGEFYGAEKRSISDREIEAMWVACGGTFHGPNVEMGRMPKSLLLPFLRSLLITATYPAQAVKLHSWGGASKYHDYLMDDGTIQTFHEDRVPWKPRSERESILIFEKVYCSQCGGEFGPAQHGYSSCESHKSKRRIS